MLVEIKLRPYAENIEKNDITDFDEDEWDLLGDLFERLIRNFKVVYPEVSFRKFDKLSKPYINITFEKEDLLDEEVDYYIEILSGYTNDNIIIFDDVEYAIRANLIFDEKKEKETILDKFNNLVLDIAPDLIKI